MSLPAGKQNEDAISTFIEHFLGCEGPRPEGQGRPGNKSVKCLLSQRIGSFGNGIGVI